MATLPLPPTTEVQITRVVKALYDAAPGNLYLNAFKEYAAQNGGVVGVADGLLYEHRSKTNAELAQMIVDNLGLAKVDAANNVTDPAESAAQNAKDFLIWQFNVAQQTGATRGQVLVDALNNLATLGSNPVFGKAAEFFNTSIAQAYSYSINPASSTYDLAVLQQADEVTIGEGGIPVPPAQESFTLTTGADTATANVFEAPVVVTQVGASVQTLNTTDKLTGTGTNPTLNATLNSATNVKPTLNGIETLNLSTIVTSNLDLSNATGVKTIVHEADVAGADLTVLKIGNKVDLGVTSSNPNGTTDTLFQFAPSVLAGSDDTLKITLTNNGVGGRAGNINAAGLGSGEAETLDVVVSGINNITSLSSDTAAGLGATTAGNGVKTYKFSGDGSINITTTLFNATTVDGSGLTEGAMSVTVDPTKVVEVTGGKGNDNVNFGAGLTLADKYDGGDGRDTLQVSTGAGLAAGNHITKVEILQVNDDGLTPASFTFDNDNVTSVDTIVHNSTGAMTYDNLVGANAADATKGVTILNGGNITVSIKGADGLGASSDAIYFNIGGTGPTGSALQSPVPPGPPVPTGAITANDIETLTFDVKANDSGVTAAGTGPITASTATNVFVKGGAAGQAFALGTVSNLGLIKIDASNFSGNLTAILTGGAEQNQILIGGSGNDTLWAGGSGATGYGGKDVLTGNGGVDTFHFSSLPGAGNDMYDATTFTLVPDGPDAGTTTGDLADLRTVIDAITDLNLGGDGVAGVDHVVIHLGAVPTTTTPVILNGGAITALTGASAGAALDALFAAGGQLDGTVAGAVGLFSFGGAVFLAGTNGGLAGFAAGDDFIIEVTGVKGTLDATDFTWAF